MLDGDMKQQLAAYLTRLVLPVEIRAFTDESQDSRDMLALLADVAEASPKITVLAVSPEERSRERAPSFSIARAGEPARIVFAGLPMGHEFTSLVLALLQTGGHPPKIDEETLEQVRGLEGELHFETFISLTCQNCPDVVQALNLMAVVNPRIRHTMIDGALFEQEVAARNILSVPAVYLNGEPFGMGRMELAEILAKLDKGAERRAAARMTSEAPYDMLIIGGGPAAVSAAVYAARKGIRVGVAAERLGGQVMDTLGIDNLISVEHTEGPQLAADFERNLRAHTLDLMTLQRATTLQTADTSTVPMHEVRFENGATLQARSVVLATGARWRELGVPGEKEYRNRGVAYCPHCDGPLYKGRDVAVIGGGNSGVEAAIDLAGIVRSVTLIEFDSKLRADAVLVERMASLPNVTVVTNAETLSVSGDGTRLTGLTLRDRASGDSRTLTLDGVFVQIGLVPNTDWLKGTVRLSSRGEIEIDSRGATSVPGVFAAGDCTTEPFKQIVVAMGAGSTAALSAFEHLIRTPAPQRAAA